MANTEVGAAYVSIMPSMKGFQKEVGGVVENTFGKVKGIVAGALATGAIAAFGKAAVSAYADYEQLVGGVDTLFKDASADVQKFAAKAYKTAGISANSYMEQVTSFSASLLQSLGGDTKKAASYADRAVRDMSDNANKMGTSMKSIQDAYQGFAKQNYTMLDNLKLGYGGTKAEMERLIQDANRVKQANGEMADLSIDSFADVTEAIHIIQEEMGITGTTAEEAEQTISGSIASMKAAWENWLVGLGDSNADMAILTDQLVETVVTAAGNLIPRIGEIMTRLAQTVAEKAPEIATKLGNALLECLPGELNSSLKSALQLWNMGKTFEDKFRLTFQYLQSVLSEQMQSLFSNLGLDALGESFTGAFNSVSGAFMDAMTAFSSTLQDLLGPALQEVQPILDYFFQTIEDASPWMSLLGEVVGTVLGTAISAAIKIFWNFVIAIGNVIEFITNCYNTIKGFVDGVYNFFTVTVPEAIQGMFNWFAQLPGKIGAWLSGAIGKVGEFAGNMKTKAIEAGKNFLNGIKTGFENAVRFVASIPQKILSAIGNVGNLLVNAGKSIIDGFLQGLKSAFGKVQDFVGGIGDWIVSHKGPPSYDAVMLVKNGELIMGGLLDGMTRGWGDVEDFVKSRNASIQARYDVGAGGSAAYGRGATNVYIDGAAVSASPAMGQALGMLFDALNREYDMGVA